MPKTNTGLTFQGKPINVTGKALAEGETFPQIKLTANDLSDFTNSTFAGKPTIISVVPSLDTPVCSISTRRFNDEITKLSSDMTVLTVSRDLPFAQKRWCGMEGATRVITASDYKYRTFAEATGTHWMDTELLARSVFVLDRTGKVTYLEYVADITKEPDYDAALTAAKKSL